MADENEVHLFPDDRGRFGDFGGKFIPETLMAAVADLDDAYRTAKANPDFQERLGHLLHTYAGRPTALYFACLLYTSPSPRDRQKSRMPSSA